MTRLIMNKLTQYVFLFPRLKLFFPPYLYLMHVYLYTLFKLYILHFQANDQAGFIWQERKLISRWIPIRGC